MRPVQGQPRLTDPSGAANGGNDDGGAPLGLSIQRTGESSEFLTPAGESTWSSGQLTRYDRGTPRGLVHVDITVHLTRLEQRMNVCRSHLVVHLVPTHKRSVCLN